MKLIIDISKDRYDEIMSMDWKNGRRFFDEEIRAIHDGKALEQEPYEDAVSRQAAINAAIDGADKWDGGFNREREKCIREEIDKLPPATPQPCEDCISSEEVCKILDRHWLSGTVARRIIDQIKDSIDQLSSVTPQPKLGKWILLDECANSGYYCSECQKKVVKEGWSDTVKKIKYCPNCGAWMKGDE